MTDSRVADTFGALTRYVHIDCTTEPVPSHLGVGRMIAALREASPASRMAFGILWLTDSEGRMAYGARHCRCQSLLRMDTAADLLRARGPVPWTIDPDADLRIAERAAARMREHARLRAEVDAGRAPQEAVAAYEAWIEQDIRRTWACRFEDGTRAAMLTIGRLAPGGGSPVGLARVLDPDAPSEPGLRESLLAAMTTAALRDDPLPASNSRHLAITYLDLAQDEIAPAVEAACTARSCSPEDLPIHALPVPRAARERLALLVCQSRRIPADDGRAALAALAAATRAA